MRWFLALVAVMAVVSVGAEPGRAAQAVPAGEVAPPSALVLVEQLEMDEALAAAGDGAGVAGFVSTLPVHQPLASRVLSLAAGRRVDALAALEDNPPSAAGLPDPATVDRIRADNPGARLGRLPPTRVLAYPGLETVGLFTLGLSGPALPPGPLGGGDRPIPLQPGRLLVLAVPDGPALANLVGRLRPAEGAGPMLVLGLRAAPGRANAAPLLVLDQPGDRGLPTSDSTRRLGLVALEDVRPTLAGGLSAGDDGARMRVVADDQPADSAVGIDRRVAALVLARTWAIPLLCLAAVLALFALVAVWRSRRRHPPDRRAGPNPDPAADRRAGPNPDPAAARRAGPNPDPAAARRPGPGSGGSRRPEEVARFLLALTLAIPPGYLVASMAEPLAARAWQAVQPGGLLGPGAGVPWSIAWVASGLVAAAALAVVALRFERPSPGRASQAGGADDPHPEPELHPGPTWLRSAPVVLGGVLLGLVVLDLALGGDGLAQPLLGGSAWDGERFYGLGNGYFAFALAAAVLVIGFAPLRAGTAAALLAGLGVVDGLPRLGADVGGALTSMLTAAAALVVLAPGRPRVRRVVVLAGLAVAAAVAVALGAGLGGPVTHAGRFAERLQQGPGDAAGVVVDQLARNLRLLANSPFAWVGPLQVALAALVALRPPPPFGDLSGWIRRVLGLGAFGSLLLILLNDTGVTATAASGLFLLAIPAWAWLDDHGPTGPPSAPLRARPVEAHR